MKFFTASSVIFSLLTWDFVNSQSTESVLRDKYDGYGEDWIFMPDGNDQPQVAVLKGHEPETVNRGLWEEGVTFLLYTRYLLFIIFIFISFKLLIKREIFLI